MAQSISPSKRTQKPNFAVTILWAAFLAGTLDITGAIIQFLLSGGDNPVRIFRYIASGAFGKQAAINPSMPYWGLLFHYIIAYTFTLAYFLLAPRLPWVLKHKVRAGILYGAIIWVVMNLVVVPSSRIGQGSFQLIPSLIGMGILIIAIGLPLAFIAAAYYARTRT